MPIVTLQLGYKTTQVAELFKAVMSRKHTITPTWLLAKKFASQGDSEMHDQCQPERRSEDIEKNISIITKITSYIRIIFTYSAIEIPGNHQVGFLNPWQ